MAGVELRPHHLLCLHFFQGYGYSPGFTAHMAGIQEALRRCPGTPVTLVSGPDPLCAHCPNLQGPACGSGKPERYDQAVLRLCKLTPGVTKPYRSLSALVEEYILRPGRLREVCGDCEWSEKCVQPPGAGAQRTAQTEKRAGPQASSLFSGAVSSVPSRRGRSVAGTARGSRPSSPAGDG